MNGERDKASGFQFTVRDLLNFTLTASIMACVIGYFYRSGAPVGAGVIGATIGAFLCAPPALAWLLFIRGHKTAAAWVFITWLLGSLSAIIWPEHS